MFDWNDEELANIIWGDGGEDHTVPYPNGSEEKPLNLYADQIKKEWKPYTTNVTSAAEKKSAAKSDMHVGKLENSFKYGEIKGLPATGFGMDSWPDMSFSNATKTDQDSLGNEASNSHTEISKRDSSRGDETAQLGIGSEIFQGCEDRDRGDFVEEYDWANIGSFGDLDRIFSNDDPIFGHNSIDNTDELWSSAEDLTTSPKKTIPLSLGSPSLGLGGPKSSSPQLQVKTEFQQDQDQIFASDYDQINDLVSNAPQNSQASIDQVDFAGGRSKLLRKDKISLEMVGKTPTFNTLTDAETVANPNNPAEKGPRQKRLFKDLKKSEGKIEAKLLFYGIWPPSVNQIQQFEGQYAVAMGHPCPYPFVSQQKQIHGAVSSPYNQCPPPLLATPIYENVANQYPAMTSLPQFHSGEDALMKPQIMTPQEKIEKLRRRQQMRAMLAIQKQHQQFTHQGSSCETYGKKISHENKMLLMTGGNAEVEDNQSVLPAFDPNSTREKDGSNTVSTDFDDCSVECAILYRLQEIIDKMDIRIRLCIRNSLVRLAQSAMQRQCASYASSKNKSNREEVLTKETIYCHKRFNRMPDSETETNPIDRTMAHLLFHMPLDLSGKLP